MNKILVAVDGSEYSIKALLKAKEIGSKFNSDITILNVIRPMQDYKYIHNKDFYKDMERSLLSQSRKLLENKCYTSRITQERLRPYIREETQLTKL